MYKPVVVVGAGAAGIGISVVLQHLEIEFATLDRDGIGASFERWPKETRFISPSFTGNAFGAVDLNAITPDTSPAYSLRSEHPSGIDYARYLQQLAEFFALPTQVNTNVTAVTPTPDSETNFTLETSQGTIQCDHLIWAAGEYRTPNRNGFTGSDLCQHFADVGSWAALKGDNFAVIGAYESGIDAAYHLINAGKEVTIFDGNNRLTKHSSDSSYTLSPYSRGRLATISEQLKVVDMNVTEVEELGSGYSVKTSDGTTLETQVAPINCTGFDINPIMGELFDFTKDGSPQISEIDESTRTDNVYLVGPQVRHDQAIFCFIYKYRQRFAVVAEAIAKRLDIDNELRQDVIDYYISRDFYLDDLSCCADECVC